MSQSPRPIAEQGATSDSKESNLSGDSKKPKVPSLRGRDVSSKPSPQIVPSLSLAPQLSAASSSTLENQLSPRAKSEMKSKVPAAQTSTSLRLLPLVPGSDDSPLSSPDSSEKKQRGRSRSLLDSALNFSISPRSRSEVSSHGEGAQCDTPRPFFPHVDTPRPKHQEADSLSTAQTFSKRFSAPRDRPSTTAVPTPFTKALNGTAISSTHLKKVASDPVVTTTTVCSESNERRRSHSDRSGGNKIESDFTGLFKRNVAKALNDHWSVIDSKCPPMSQFELALHIHRFHSRLRQAVLNKCSEAPLEKSLDEFFESELREILIRCCSEVDFGEWLTRAIERLKELQALLLENTQKKTTQWSKDFAALLNQLTDEQFSISVFFDVLENSDHDKTSLGFIQRAIGDSSIPRLLRQSTYALNQERLRERALLLKWFHEHPIRFRDVMGTPVDFSNLDRACDEILRMVSVTGLLADITLNGEKIGFSFSEHARGDTKEIQREFFRFFLPKLLASGWRPCEGHFNLENEIEKIVGATSSIFTPLLARCTFGTTWACNNKMRFDVMRQFFNGEDHFRGVKLPSDEDPTGGIRIEITANADGAEISQRFNYTILYSPAKECPSAASMMPVGKLFVQWTIPDQNVGSKCAIEFLDWILFSDIGLDLERKFLALLTSHFNWPLWVARNLMGQLPLNWRESDNLNNHHDGILPKPIDEINLNEWLEATFLTPNGLSFKQLSINGEEITFPSGVQEEQSLSAAPVVPYDELKRQFFDMLQLKISCGVLDDAAVSKVLRACTPIALASTEKLLRSGYPLFFEGDDFRLKRETHPEDPTTGVICAIETLTPGILKVARTLNYRLYYTPDNLHAATLELLTVMTWDGNDWEVVPEILNLQFGAEVDFQLKLKILSIVRQSRRPAITTSSR